MTISTPVVLIIYKRPDTTSKVLDAIAKVRPVKLFVIADGANRNNPTEIEKINQTRALLEQIEWKCEIRKNFANVNLGLRKRVVSGLNWVFDQVDQAIILEDDCVPDPSFFRFCDELLERYQDDQRIMTISGVNFQNGRKRTSYSYYFSRYNHCWGWATWRRSWVYYDDSMSLWPMIRDGEWLMDLLDGDRIAVNYWEKIFDKVNQAIFDSWAYRWTFINWVQGGLTILPNENLVSNIGFGSDATHTSHRSSKANMPVKAIDFPLSHPPFVIRDRKADQYTQKQHFGTGYVKTIKRTTAHFLRKLGFMD